MKKTERQQLIVEIVRAERIATQGDVRDALASRGVECDQGTVSRDIRELGLVKAVADDGESYYASVADVVPPSRRGLSASVLKALVRGVVASGNLIVVQCGPGNASAVGEALDRFGLPEIIGTVAGDDTLLVVVREGVSGKKTAEKLAKEIGIT